MDDVSKLRLSFQHFVAEHGGLDSAILRTNFGLNLSFTILKENNPARNVLGFAWAESLSPCCGEHLNAVVGECSACRGDATPRAFLSGSSCPLAREDLEHVVTLCLTRINHLLVILATENIIALLNHLLDGAWAWEDIPETSLESFVNNISASAA